jgi:HK97 family phage portal protein
VVSLKEFASRLWHGEMKYGDIPATGTPAWYDMLAGSTRGSKAGQHIDARTALETTTALVCTRVIAEGLAQVPCRLFQMMETGDRREAIEHPLHRLLYRRPNEWQTAFEFREQIGAHLALCGNAYVVKIRDSLGRLIELLPYQPGAVSVWRESDFSVRYYVTIYNKGQIEIPAADIWHIRGMSWNGYLGMEPIQMARNALGLALAAEEFGSELFANGARPSGILTSDSPMSAANQADVKASWQAANSGSGNRMKTALLNSNLKWQAIAQSADEAQFIEARKLQVVEICRAMRVLPIMAMHQDGTAAYASVEQMFLAHVTHTLAPWFERFEQSAEVNLLTEKEQADGYYIELVEHGLMRGTAKDRAEYGQILALNGVISPNDFAAMCDLPRSDLPGMDDRRFAQNLYGPPDMVEEASETPPKTPVKG